MKINWIGLEWRSIGVVLLFLTASAANAEGPVWPTLTGFVDLHAHPLSNLAFGGKLIYGGVDIGALLPTDPSCNHNVRAGSLQQALGNDNSTHGGWGLDNTCGDDIRVKVIHGLQQQLKANDPGDGSVGASDFSDWPKSNDVTHQKMWVDWIRRAHDGGLSVMVALAVNNKTLGDSVAGPNDFATDDMSSADRQIQETISFVGRHNDFMEVAYTPQDLLRINQAHKLAVVIGVEIDNIGNLQTVNSLTQTAIANEVQRLYNEGVRYVFPVHIIDNPFGGTAVYEDSFNLSNYREAGHFWNLTCSDPADNIAHKYTYSTNVGLAFIEAIKLGSDFLRQPPTPPSCPAGTGHVNAQGLTPNGTILLQELMKRGMLIDIDHMSQATQRAALSVAEANPSGGYPMNSGHSVARDMVGPGGDERSPPPDIYRRIAALHGMAGIGTANLDAYQWESAASHVVGLMAQNIPALQALNGDLAVGLGTDTDGLAPGMPSRAGSNINSALPASSTGNKTWNYNTDGVAHYGLLSEFVQDAQTAPGGASIIGSNFMNGAGYFYNTWLKAVELTPTSPLNVSPVLTVQPHTPSLFKPALATARSQVQPGESVAITGTNFNTDLYNTVSLSWTDPTTALLTRFQIQGMPSGNQSDLPRTTNFNSPSDFTVTNISPNTGYVFTVRDCDNVVCSKWSNAVTYTSGPGLLTAVTLSLKPSVAPPAPGHFPEISYQEGSAAVNSSGALSATIQIGSTVPPGAYTLTASSGNTVMASVPITVVAANQFTPVLEIVDPDTGATSTSTRIGQSGSVILKGEGFEGGAVKLTLDTAGGTVLGPATATGSPPLFKTTLTLKPTVIGTHQIVASQTVGTKILQSSVTVVIQENN